MFIQLLFFVLSLILTILFFLYGFNQYFLLNAARRYWVPALPEPSKTQPTISIQLPIYNERYVLRRLVAACAGMAEAYGKGKASILLLDDSDDDTVLEVDQVVEEYRKKHFQIDVLRRECRNGFKAGALQAALKITEEEFITIFDADFIPSTDFLNCTLPYFNRNECLGIVQGRWSHLNQDYNLLTQAISHAIDIHFLVEQPGRYSAGLFQNFNGSGGVLRKKAVLEAGGWQEDTLAEDLDLSYRMQLLGYRVLYLRDILCPGEIPPTVPSFKKQQGRWACGSLRTARKLLPVILNNRKLTWKLRLQAFIHLTGYILHPMMLLAFILLCVQTLNGGQNDIHLASFLQLGISEQALRVTGALVLQYLAWELLIVVIAICAAAPWASALIVLKSQNQSIVRNLSSLVVLFLIGYGVSLSNTIEAGKALLSNRNWAFARTPKYATAQADGDWKTKNYQTSLDFVWVLELALVIFGGITISFSIHRSNFGILLFLLPYTASYAFVCFLTVIQSRKGRIS